MKVYKYKINPEKYISLLLPIGARILSIQAQFEEPTLWALVDPNAPTEVRNFLFVGTGHDISESPEKLQFIDTFQMHGGNLVFHLFEIVP